MFIGISISLRDMSAGASVALTNHILLQTNDRLLMENGDFFTKE